MFPYAAGIKEILDSLLLLYISLITNVTGNPQLITISFVIIPMAQKRETYDRLDLTLTTVGASPWSHD